PSSPWAASRPRSGDARCSPGIWDKPMPSPAGSDLAPPPAATGSPAVSRRLGVALGMALAVAAVGAVALGLALVGSSVALPTLVGVTLVLGLVQVGLLIRARSEAGPGTSSTAPAVAAPGRNDPPQVAQELRALLAAGSSDEVGTLMREFTRILEVLQ